MKFEGEESPNYQENVPTKYKAKFSQVVEEKCPSNTVWHLWVRSPKKFKAIIQNIFGKALALLSKEYKFICPSLDHIVGDKTSAAQSVGGKR